MKRTAITGAAALAAALALVLTGCGSDTKTEPSTSKSETDDHHRRRAPRPRRRRRPRSRRATRMRRARTRRSPATSPRTTSRRRRSSAAIPARRPSICRSPTGWEPAGENTPEWAYGAIIYTGPEAAEYSPSIVALVSKLTGNVDPQTDHRPGSRRTAEPAGLERVERGREQHPRRVPGLPARWHLGVGWADQDRRAEDGRDPRRRRPLRAAAQRRRPGEPGRHRGCGNQRHRRADDHHAVT